MYINWFAGNDTNAEYHFTTTEETLEQISVKQAAVILYHF